MGERLLGSLAESGRLHDSGALCPAAARRNDWLSSTNLLSRSDNFRGKRSGMLIA